MSPRPPAQRPHLIADDAEAITTARHIAADFADGAAQRDRERRLPWAELDAFVASGLWGITVPRAFGGAGVCSETVAEVTALVSAADGSLGQIPQNHYYALEVLRVRGAETQQRFFYDRVLADERFGNALAEIGHKDFKRRTRLTSGERETSSPVFVPNGAPGIAINDDWDGFGQRVTGSGSVAFDDVAVEADWIVPFAASFERPTAIGPFAQILHAAIDLGLGEGAFAQTLAFVRDESRPWIDAKVDRAGDDPLTIAQVGEARVLTTTAALDASTRLFELAGTASALDDRGLDRFWRNARTHTLHDPVRWKYHAVGNFVLNDRLPPRHGAL